MYCFCLFVYFISKVLSSANKLSLKKNLQGYHVAVKYSFLWIVIFFSPYAKQVIRDAVS